MNTPEAWLKTHNELQSASFHTAICINLHGNLTQVTAQLIKENEVKSKLV